MEYSNLNKLVAILTEWLRPMLNAIAGTRLNALPNISAANAWVRKFFPVKADYSIVNDLSFLVNPLIEQMLQSTVSSKIASLNIQDSEIPNFVLSVINSAKEEIAKKGKLTLFNIVELESADIENLEVLINKNLATLNFTKYEVIK